MEVFDSWRKEAGRVIEEEEHSGCECSKLCSLQLENLPGATHFINIFPSLWPLPCHVVLVHQPPHKGDCQAGAGTRRPGLQF